MACTCVVGLQWGDEAKGKIVDLLTATHDLVIRYNGGANAGHTVVSGDRTYKFSLLPTGVLHPHLRSVIGNGVGDLLYPDHLRDRLRLVVARKNRLLKALAPDAKQFDAAALCDEYLGYAEKLRPHIKDTTRLLHQALQNGQRLLFEAAQGSL